jgi:A/G-specific adenine glycosylase
MLQQTQVATVIPFFHRFLKTFPTVQSLAAADEELVLRHWEGLGYYRRARHLHQAARQLVARHDGTMPDDPDVWRTLPGVGRYTLGAILSQAFDRRLPILEANTIRLLCRLFAVRQSPRVSSVVEDLWQRSEKLLPVKRAGDFNQGLMELGALICTPKAPACRQCPLSSRCAARKLGIQASLPVLPRPASPVAIDEVAIVLRRRRQVLVMQRPAAGRWANLWEFPHGEVQAGEALEVAAARVLTDLTGMDAELGPPLATLTHTITKYVITLVCLEGRHKRGALKSTYHQQGRWMDPARLAQLPFSSPQRRLAQLLAPTDARF